MRKKMTSFLVLLAVLLSLPTQAKDGSHSQSFTNKKMTTFDLKKAAVVSTSTVKWDWAAHASKQFVPQKALQNFSAKGQPLSLTTQQREQLLRNRAFTAYSTVSHRGAVTEGHGIITEPVDVYSLDGKLVRKQVTSLSGLKGVYIVDGKKVVLK